VEQEFEHPRWEQIWAGEFPPHFDKQTVCPAFQSLIDKNSLPKGRALVPGCGRGYDVTALAESGDRYCVGVDISTTAIWEANERLREILEFCEKCEIPIAPKPEKVEFKCMSFFDIETDTPEKLWDFVYDYIFLCSLDPRIHDKWAKKMKELVKIDGELLCMVFPVMEKEGGPPWGMDLEYVCELLQPEFEVLILKDRFQKGLLPPAMCHEGRGGPMEGMKAEDGDDWDAKTQNKAGTGIIRFKRVEIDESDYEEGGGQYAK
jgi:hypothetical protein